MFWSSIQDTGGTMRRPSEGNFSLLLIFMSFWIRRKERKEGENMSCTYAVSSCVSCLVGESKSELDFLPFSHI